ncbi:MAG: bi-domain-containing oxidoreductase [Candidatus Krumholzibacteriia bacterium]
MKILALRLRDGAVTLTEAPSPLLEPGFVRVRTLHSAVSPGTEGGKITAGKKSLVGKALARPDQVRQVIEMGRSVGVAGALQKVRAKLEGAQPLGYSLAGTVSEVGPGVTGLRRGDLVACAGGGYANHADEVVVPRNLVARVPDGVSADAAALTTLGAIALQGVRLASPSLGENAVVVGLGVVGLLASQLLKSAGCRVFGTDISEPALELARRSGSVDAAARLGGDPAEAAIQEFCRGRGADIVLICAATSSNEPVELAGRVCRKRGRVVVVGAVGMDLPRDDYYAKELQFSVSCSYGPGRYDPDYEEKGLDYPVGFVRWTEGRNLEAVLDMMAAGSLRPLALVTHRFPFAEAPRAYELISGHAEPFAGILLDYPAGESSPLPTVVLKPDAKVARETVGIGCIGAGSYAQSFLLPPLRRSAGVRLTAIFTRTGLSAVDAGRRFGFSRAVDSAAGVLDDPETDAVLIATRHDQHGPLVLAALERGKHVFVEKPLCITRQDLERIAALARRLADEDRLPLVQTGFNRRFSPGLRRLRKHFGSEPGPLMMVYRVSAGPLPQEHWSQDPELGGGRLVGEVCHFVDVMQSLTGAEPVLVSAQRLVAAPEAPPQDDCVLTIRFSDGSVGTVAYTAQGARSVPKELLEVHGSGRSAVLDNFATVHLHGSRGRKRVRCPGKGQAEEVAAFVGGLRSGVAPIPLTSQLLTTLATLQAVESLRAGTPFEVDLRDLAWTSD